jgi:hypothetical protein
VLGTKQFFKLCQNKKLLVVALVGGGVLGEPSVRRKMLKFF